MEYVETTLPGGIEVAEEDYGYSESIAATVKVIGQRVPLYGPPLNLMVRFCRG